MTGVETPEEEVIRLRAENEQLHTTIRKAHHCVMAGLTGHPRPTALVSVESILRSVMPHE